MTGVSALDEDGLRQLVNVFYAHVRADPALGPIFNEAIGDWPEHLEKLISFWSSVMLTSGRYKGQPVLAHLKHKARITPGLFDRWLALWAETTHDVMAPQVAAALQAKAGRIAQSLQLAMFFPLDDQPTTRPARQTADATDHAQRSMLP